MGRTPAGCISNVAREGPESFKILLWPNWNKNKNKITKNKPFPPGKPDLGKAVRRMGEMSVKWTGHALHLGAVVLVLHAGKTRREGHFCMINISIKQALFISLKKQAKNQTKLHSPKTSSIPLRHPFYHLLSCSKIHGFSRLFSHINYIDWLLWPSTDYFHPFCPLIFIFATNICTPL